MVSEKMYEKLAELAVRKGVNLQKGQPLVIRANLRDVDLVRKIVKIAYENGASSVSIDWRDEELSLMNYKYQSIETLSDIPQWLYDKTKLQHEQKAAYLSIASDKPGALKEIDSAKMNAYQQAYYKKMADLQAYTMNNEGQWCVLGVPSVEWAKVVFPELSDEEAFEKLGDAIFAVTRVGEDNDPIAEWELHDRELIEHANKLNELDLKALHFTSELGTDLTVELVEDHIWVGGGCTTPEGVFFDPNMPTEECFCMPLKNGVNGIVHASKPLSYQGKVIEDFWFRFENGKVVEHDAKKEKEALTQLLDFDEGSRYLGEVALVPYDSPVSKSGILFFNTLYDENAACHLALGRPYPENIRGGEQMSREELLSHGANDSLQHEDFMFGTREMDIDGIRKDGSTVPIFRKGNFVF
ncbi:MAG: aminopeptidase [Erysipelotrichaceae bacterium]|nr:aminopeptidase [Erysipelotrichaceae bacterium]